MGSFRVETPAGRLLVARWSGFRKREEAAAFRSEIMGSLARLESAVICADWRQADLVLPEVAEVLLSMLQGSHRYMVRSAILLTTAHATFGLQAERLVRESGSPARRTFRAPDAMLAWLGEILTPEEQEAADRFLGQDG